MVMRVHFPGCVICRRVWRLLYPGQALPPIYVTYDHGVRQNRHKRTFKLNGSKKGGES